MTASLVKAQLTRSLIILIGGTLNVLGPVMREGDEVRKILDIPNKILRSLAENMIIRWLRSGALGEHGKFIQRVLVFLQGKKTALGFLFGLAAYLCKDLVQDDTWLGVVGGILMGVGLIDKAVRQPGRPPEIAASWLYQTLANNAGTLATALTAAFVYVTGPTCVAWAIWNLSLSCVYQGKALFFVAATLVYIGILDTAFLSKTPASVVIAKAEGLLSPLPPIKDKVGTLSEWEPK